MLASPNPGPARLFKSWFISIVFLSVSALVPVAGIAQNVNAPTIQASGLNFTSVGTSGFTINWTNGNGGARLVVVRPIHQPSNGPVDDVLYLAPPGTPVSFTATTGSILGGGKVMYRSNGAGNSVTINNLHQNTTYWVHVFEFNYGGNFTNPNAQKYLTTTSVGNSLSVTTASVSAVAQASYISFSNITSTSMTLTWRNGTNYGDNKRIVVARAGSLSVATPVNGQTYTADAAYGSGSLITSSYVVYNGSGNTVTVTNLAPNTRYYFRVFEYTEALATNPTYLITENTPNGINSGNPPANQYTAPSIQTSSLVLSAVGTNEMTLNWTNGDGLNRVIFVREDSPVTTIPQEGVTYSASTVFGNGSMVGVGTYVVFAGNAAGPITITNLEDGVQYYIQAFEYSGSNYAPTSSGISSLSSYSSNKAVYLTDPATNNPAAQLTTIKFNYRTRAAGDWSNAAIWEQYRVQGNNEYWENANTAPGNRSKVNIRHDVTLSTVTNPIALNIGSTDADLAVPGGTLTVQSGGVLTLTKSQRVGISCNMLGTYGKMYVHGNVVLQDQATWVNSSAVNTFFYSGSTYEHQYRTNEGIIPLATWDPNSTILFSAFNPGSVDIFASASGNWSQNFGNVTFNCPAIAANRFIRLNGFLTSIQGDLTVLSTGLSVNGIVLNATTALAGSVSPVVNVAGDVVVQQTGVTASVLSLSVTPTTDNSPILNIAGNLMINNDVNYAIGALNGATLRGPNSNDSDRYGRVAFVTNTNHTLYNTGAIVNHLHMDVPDNINLEIATEKGFGSTGDFSLGNNSVLIVGSGAVTGAFPDGTGTTGALFNSGTRSFGNPCTIIFNGASDQFVGNSYPATPNINLIVNKPAGTLRSDHAFSVTGNLTLQQGAMEAPTGTNKLTLAGDLIRTNGTFLHNSGTVLLNGTGSQATQTIDVDGAQFYTIEVNKAGGGLVDIISHLPLQHLLDIQSATQIQNPTAPIPTTTQPHNVDQSSWLNQGLALLSTGVSTGDDASIGPLPAGASVTGHVTVQRYMNDKGKSNRYISSPVANAAVFQFQDDFAVSGRFAGSSYPCTGCQPSNGPSFRWYNEAATGNISVGYVALPTVSNSQTLITGRGYLAYMWQSGITTWDVAGAINSGTIPMTLSHTVSAGPATDGWHLLGNPYPSAISWRAANMAEWNPVNIDATIAVPDVDMLSAGYPAYYRYWNAADESGTLTTLADGIIAMGQAFWIHVTDPGSGSLNFTENLKTSSTTGEFLRAPGLTRSEQLVVTIDNGIRRDEAFFKLNPLASEKFDRFDAYKLKNEEMNVYFPDQGRELVMHTVKDIDKETKIPVAVEVAEAGTYSFSFANAENFRYGQELYFIDLTEQKAMRLGSGSKYTVTFTDPAKPITGRFYLSRSNMGFDDEFSVFVYPNPGRDFVHVKVSGADSQGVVSIMDGAGKVLQVSDFSTETTLDMTAFGPGMYYVIIRTGSRTTTRKFIKL